MLRSDEFLTIIDFVFRNFPRDGKIKKGREFYNSSEGWERAQSAVRPPLRAKSHIHRHSTLFFQGLQVTIASDINFEPHINYMIIIMLSSIGV